MRRRDEFDNAVVFTNIIFALVTLALVMAMVAFPVVSLMGGWLPNYSNGFRVGNVMKASEKGVLCAQTFSGELVLDGFGSRATNRPPGAESTPISNVWEFAATDRKVIDALVGAADRGKRVRVVYSQWFVRPFCLHSDYVVTAVKVVE